ncbi:MAG: hypothetical protein GEV08_17270, partial [Acidimicrobiia bacterium]|nr:hypothetical protein [Acidimicrobiia bacterium]
CRRAANQAMRSVAYDEAIRHLQAGLDLGPAVAERVDILLDLGEARSRHGLHRDAMASFAECFGAARDEGLVARAAQAAAGFGMATQMPGLPGGPAVEIASEALALLGDVESPLRTRLQATLARSLALAGRNEEAVVIGEAALATARRHGDPSLLVSALQSSLVYSLEPRRYTDEAIELTELARQLGDRWSYGYGLGCQVRGLLILGRVADAREAHRAQREAADEGRFVLFGYMVRSFDAMFAMIDGRLDDAERRAEEAHEFGESSRTEFDAGVYGVQMYAIRREQGRLDEVAPLLRLASTLGPDQAVWRPGLAALYADLGMLDAAREAFELLARDDFAEVPRDAMWPCCLVFLSEVCAALGDRDRAAVLYAELEPLRGFTMMAGFTICLGPADRLMGNLAALLGRRRDAEGHFAAAVALAERTSSAPWRARAQHDWAVALGGRPDLLRAAHATAAALGMRAVAEGCRSHLDHGDVAPGAAAPAAPPWAARAGHGGPPAGLSQREVEVLRLVATGLSNRQIGECLLISHNTAANHVRAILQKTASANRAEATAYAARHGLLG